MGVMSIKIFLVIKRHFFLVFHVKVSRNQPKKNQPKGFGFRILFYLFGKEINKCLKIFETQKIFGFKNLKTFF